MALAQLALTGLEVPGRKCDELGDRVAFLLGSLARADSLSGACLNRGGRKDEKAELDELKKKIEEAGMSDEAKDKA